MYLKKKKIDGTILLVSLKMTLLNVLKYAFYLYNKIVYLSTKKNIYV